MVAVGMNIDSKNVEAALKGFTDGLDDTVQEALDKAKEKVLSDARMYHRFKNRTGNLSNAISATISKELAEFSISDAQADYGKYIHDGKRGWAPDPFLTSAVESNQQYITDIISTYIDRSIAKEGLR